jgi:hypothetical protein
MRPDCIAVSTSGRKENAAMSTRFDAHISEESFELYSMGRLPQNELEHFEEHLLLCSSCEERLTESDRFVRVMREATRRVQTAPDPAKPLWNPRMAWGLAAAAAIAVIVAVPRFQTVSNPPQEIALSAMRGPENATVPSVSADRPITLRIDVAELPAASAYALEVVDVKGGKVWQGRAAVQEGTIVQPIGRTLSAGQYWVRLYGEGPEPVLLREFSMLVKN